MTTQLNLDQLFDENDPDIQYVRATIKKLDDICANNHRNADTSVLANPSQQRKEKDKQTILAALQRAKEASCQRLEVTTGIPHETCSARISELLRDNRIAICGRSTTISGKPCRLYRVV